MNFGRFFAARDGLEEIGGQAEFFARFAEQGHVGVCPRVNSPNKPGRVHFALA